MTIGFLKRTALTLVEQFIVAVARRRNASTLQFSPTTNCTLPKQTRETPTLLYLHVPFCEELCPYCSFNRVEFKEGLARRYFDALRKEILMYRDQGYDFRALYVGGGTPTVLIDELVATLRLVRETFSVAEVSVETNPNHLSPETLAVLKKSGVNRLSVGVQTFDDTLLKAIKRYHKYGSGKEIAARLKEAQGIFDTLNVDMIFNFPGQSRELLEQDLSQLLELQPDQMTFYPLMSSTRTQEAMQRDLGNQKDGTSREFYETITKALACGYRATTAWCFSKNDAKVIDEYVIQYEEYAGLGSGAIGHLGGSAYANTFDIEAYISRVQAGELPIAAKKDFSIRERLLGDFLMKLFGMQLDLSTLNARHGGVNSLRYLWPEVLFFRLLGGITRSRNLLTLTPQGQYYWVLLMREFFIGVNNFRDYCRAATADRRGN